MRRIGSVPLARSLQARSGVPVPVRLSSFPTPQRVPLKSRSSFDDDEPTTKIPDFASQLARSLLAKGELAPEIDTGQPVDSIESGVHPTPFALGLEPRAPVEAAPPASQPVFGQSTPVME